ncbi:hypothetical protein [Paenibacillus sp. FJAT-26967]|uniref:hypothetical protein n=1 Tax=Paenibacillus sp. FJAT-26967 TaxID=1729690 RepID=UPI000838F402|nr:hypothetical protein [Paenibacillus sp. FJAT-26967]
MKLNRTLLLGIGIGMMAGASLLQLMVSAGQTAQPLTTSTTVSVEGMDLNKLKTETGNYYQVFDKSQVLYTKEQFDQELQKQLQLEKDKLAAVPPAPPPPQVTAIYIAPGMQSSNVAKIVSISGLVQDQAGFEQAMAAKKATGKIKSGVHKFVGTPTLDELIQNLITKPE